MYKNIYLNKMFSIINYTNPLYWWYEIDDTMLCISSFAPTNRRFNYVVIRAEPDED